MGAVKYLESPDYAHGYLPEICKGLFFRSILRMCIQNLTCAALPVPEIIGGTEKIRAVPGYAHASFFPKFLMVFCSDGPGELENDRFKIYDRCPMTDVAMAISTDADTMRRAWITS